MSMDYKKDRPPKDWGVTRTKQSEEAKCNINNIIKMYTRTGELTHVSQALMSYRDMSGIPDLHACMNIVADAQSSFMELPSHIRKACNHDVGDFLAYLDNPDNTNGLVDAGVLPEDQRIPEVETPPEIPTEESAVQGGE